MNLNKVQNWFHKYALEKYTQNSVINERIIMINNFLQNVSNKEKIKFTYTQKIENDKKEINQKIQKKVYRRNLKEKLIEVIGLNMMELKMPYLFCSQIFEILNLCYAKKILLHKKKIKKVLNYYDKKKKTPSKKKIKEERILNSSILNTPNITIEGIYFILNENKTSEKELLGKLSRTKNKLKKEKKIKIEVGNKNSSKNLSGCEKNKKSKTKEHNLGNEYFSRYNNTSSPNFMLSIRKIKKDSKKDKYKNQKNEISIINLSSVKSFKENDKKKLFIKKKKSDEEEKKVRTKKKAEINLKSTKIISLNLKLKSNLNQKTLKSLHLQSVKKTIQKQNLKNFFSKDSKLNFTQQKTNKTKKCLNLKNKIIANNSKKDFQDIVNIDSNKKKSVKKKESSNKKKKNEKTSHYLLNQKEYLKISHLKKNKAEINKRNKNNKIERNCSQNMNKKNALYIKILDMKKKMENKKKKKKTSEVKNTYMKSSKNFTKITETTFRNFNKNSLLSIIPFQSSKEFKKSSNSFVPFKIF